MDDEERNGEMHPGLRCHKRGHQYGHTATIKLNRHGMCKQEEKDYKSPQRLESMLVTLLHEQVHAWIFFFIKHSSVDVYEETEHQKAGLHGEAWVKLMSKCLVEGLHHLKIQGFKPGKLHGLEDDHVGIHAESDFDILSEHILPRAWTVEENEWDWNELFNFLSGEMGISREGAQYYRALREHGWDRVEAVWLLKCGREAAFSWDHKGRDLPLPENYPGIAYPEEA